MFAKIAPVTFPEKTRTVIRIFRAVTVTQLTPNGFSADGMKDICDNCPFVFDQTFEDVSIRKSYRVFDSSNERKIC